MLRTAPLCLLLAIFGQAEDLHIRSTGTIRAVHVFNVLVPTIRGSNVRLTVTKIIANGTLVHEGDIIAEFDRTQQFDDARDAKAKVDDLGHQLEQQKAQYRSDAAKRASDLKSAEAALAKAEIELRKGEVLSEIDRLKNEAIVESARARVDSLKKSGHFHDLDEAAGLRILELQRNRQELVLERTKKLRKREVWVGADPSTRDDLSQSRPDLYRYVLQVVNLLRPPGGIPAHGGSSYDPR